MRWTEQLKEDRKKLLRMGDARQRAVFIWDYYKFPLLALLFLLLFLFAVFLGNAGRKDVCLHAVLINNDSLIRDCDDTVFDRLLADAGIDTGRKKTEISADFSLGMSEDESDDIETLQVLNAMFLMYDIDLYVSDERYFEYFADSDAFADLNLLIDADLLSAVPDTERYYYTDSNGVRTLKGIRLREGSALHEAGYYHNEVIIGAVGSGDNLDKAIAVISQLLSNRK